MARNSLPFCIESYDTHECYRWFRRNRASWQMSYMLYSRTTRWSLAALSSIQSCEEFSCLNCPCYQFHHNHKTFCDVFNKRLFSYPHVKPKARMRHRQDSASRSRRHPMRDQPQYEYLHSSQNEPKMSRSRDPGPLVSCTTPKVQDRVPVGSKGHRDRTSTLIEYRPPITLAGIAN